MLVGEIQFFLSMVNFVFVFYIMVSERCFSGVFFLARGRSQRIPPITNKNDRCLLLLLVCPNVRFYMAMLPYRVTPALLLKLSFTFIY